MASSSLSNFLSLFMPSKPSPSPPKLPPPSHLSLDSSSSSKHKEQSFTPLISNSTNELMSVVCPSLLYSNTLFFRSAYNVQVIVDDNEPEEKLLGRFRREVMRAGIIQECKRRKYHENKQDEKKRKTREAAKRNRRRLRTPFRAGPPDRVDTAKSSKKEEDDDNWELPQGGLPG
ncbi:PERQ amino acid-rich with GYF domain-containing protein 2-like [Heracleum sosnowskyi]|uniref:PERQ amino acid-rich with GYF domain-containing protein 2-like n=1 Tax=Heracleum sosnowskyi TaxID=360622 RepID=A0AAD8MF30_9APIA|nr:PERQ amino acid-rich with GYF domain-containing protein 2-like [Heracleum sosnowskyi]